MADACPELWIALIEAGFAQPAHWQAWAEREIAERDTAPGWLIDVLESAGRTPAVSAFAGAPRDASIDAVSLRLGLLSRCYSRGELDIVALLRQAGDLTDGRNYDDPPCDAFYMLATQIEQRGAPDPSDLAGVDALFAPHVAYLERSLGALAGSLDGL